MAQTGTPPPRWIPLLGGLLGSTTCGLLLYAFSVFIKPLQAQFGWTVPQVALAYALICLVFGLVTFPAGRMSDKYGPRIVVLVGSVLMAFGFFMVSTIKPPSAEALAAGEKASTQLWLLYLYYGVLCGLGGGMMYLPPISTAPKWWPDRRALATGFTVVGLGLGSFIMAPLAAKMIAYYDSALPVFRYVGIAMGIMGVAAALCLSLPPVGYTPPGWTPPTPQGGSQKATRDYTYQEARRTPQFWLLWVAYFCGSFAGLMVIGLIAKHGVDAMTLAYKAQHGLDAAATLPKDVADRIIVATASAPMTLAIFNALVRIVIGSLADRIGTKKIFVVLFSLQTLAMLLLFPAGKTTVLLAAVAGLIGWNYGAMFTLFPVTLLQYYGPSAQGSNYGLLFTAWGVAGFCGPYCGGLLQQMTNSFQTPFLVSAALLFLAVIILSTLKAPKQKTL